MNRAPIILLLVVSIALILPAALLVQTVHAQSSGYTIQNVNQTVEVMYSGQTAISYIISVNGTLPNNFQVGLPSNYSTYILKAYAYDNQNNAYQVEFGTQLGDQTGFYVAQIDLNGASPQILTLTLILSNSLLTQSSDVYALNYPAFPGLTQTAATCNVTIELPIAPTSINITKSDGTVNSTSYSIENLAAFTNETAVATFQLTSGYLQNMDITQLNRQVTVDPTGTVTAADTYNIKNTSPSSIGTFIFNLPSGASNVTITDSNRQTLTTTDLNSTSNSKQIQATLSSTVASGDSIILIAQYTLPLATVQGTTYTVTFNQFPSTNYYIDTATLIFNPPEGAIISTSTLDSSINVTRTNYQESLTTTQQGISFVNYNIPGATTLQVTFDYNTIWTSYRPVIIVLVLVIIVSIGIIIWRKYKSRSEKKQPTATKEEEASVPKPATVAPDLQRDFTDIFEARKQITSEITSLDARARKGKIQRQQYKAKKRELETRYDSLTRRIEESKQTFRNLGSANADLIKQLDHAESDLKDIEEKIKTIETRQDSQQISIEEYKKSTVDYQRQKEKIEATINGILLRLREKTR